MDDANGKPLDLGSVVEALERIERGYKAMTPTHIRDTAQQALATIRSTVTPAPVAKVECGWNRDEWSESWSAGCGAEWIFPDGGPAENDMKFCPSCGKPVTILAQLPGVEVIGE